MRVKCKSGKVLTIPHHDPVFVPVGNYREGDTVDPETVEFESGRATAVLERGQRIIVDNTVEIVESVR